VPAPQDPPAASPIPLTVVLAAMHDSPELRSCIAVLEPQLERAGGEMLVVDGSPGGELAAIAATALPGGDVFALRAAGARIARGRVVAFTEDHCTPADDWCERLLAVHDRHPHTVGVGGAIVNGATTTLMDWANFLAVFAPFLPPLRSTGGRAFPVANVSVKREVLDEHELPPGRLELEIVPHLHRVGHMVLAPDVQVAHVQSHGRWRTLLAHFDNGRASASLPRRSPPLRERLTRTGHALLLPLRLLPATIARGLRHRPSRVPTLVTAPLVAGLFACHSAGEVTGLIAGPGRSPARVD
jgi:hypothetical protein